MRKLLLACTALIALTASADAAIVRTLGGLNWTVAGTELGLGGVPTGNQVDNNPCIICGANQPNQTNTALDFGYTDYGNTGKVGTFAYFSSGTLRDKVLGQDAISAVNYTGQQIIDAVAALGGENGAFGIGVDMNDTKVAQTLESFFFLDLTSKTVLGYFSPELLDGVLLPSVNNGTGFPDYTLNGLTTNGLIADHEYAFFARISGANDGPDSFFLTPGVQAAVPEPGTWLLLICGFAGVGFMAYRRKQAFRMA